jgi:hypothetical protein
MEIEKMQAAFVADRGNGALGIGWKARGEIQVDTGIRSKRGPVEALKLGLTILWMCVEDEQARSIRCRPGLDRSGR